MGRSASELIKPLSIRPYVRQDGGISWAIDKRVLTRAPHKQAGIVVAVCSYYDIDYEFFAQVTPAAWAAALKDKRKMEAIRSLERGITSRAIAAAWEYFGLKEKELGLKFIQVRRRS